MNLKINIKCDGAAFDDVGLFQEVRLILGTIQNDLPVPTASEKFYRDSNGNTCASAAWEKD